MEFAKKLLFLCCVLIILMEAMETEKKSERSLLPIPLSQNTTVIQSNFSNLEYQNKIREEFNNLKITTSSDKQWHHINIQYFETLIENQIKEDLKTKQENENLSQKLIDLQKPSTSNYYPKTTFLLGVLTGNMFAFCAYYAYNSNFLKIFKLNQ